MRGSNIHINHYLKIHLSYFIIKKYVLKDRAYFQKLC